MKQTIKGNKLYKNQLPPLRNVGAKPCDFNFLKHRSPFKETHRKSLPTLQTIQEANQKQINLSLRLNMKKQPSQSDQFRKKNVISIDRWKQKYENHQSGCSKQRAHKRYEQSIAPLITAATSINWLSQSIHTKKSLGKTKAVKLADLIKESKQKQLQPDLDSARYQSTELKRDDSTNPEAMTQRPVKNLTLTRYIDRRNSHKKRQLNVNSVETEQLLERWQIINEDQEWTLAAMRLNKQI